ncbi:MAG: TetR family transcriptional regulator [Alphaproteobacteria bacterium]
MAKRPRNRRDRIIDAALGLAAEKPWRTVSLGEIAAAAKVGLADLHGEFPSRTAILGGVMARADAAVLSDIDPSTLSEPPRDRLLDALLRRLDALAPHKAAIGAILRDTRCDPVGALCLAPRLLSSMGWTLEAAGIGSVGLSGRLRVKGLTAIWLGALAVWLRDDSKDQGKTMAFLDRRLRQAERLACLLPDARRPGKSGPVPT